LFFGQLAAVAATAAPHRFPRRVDASVLAEQQLVADTFHRHNLLGRAVRIPDARPAPIRQAAVGLPLGTA